MSPLIRLSASLALWLPALAACDPTPHADGEASVDPAAQDTGGVEEGEPSEGALLPELYLVVTDWKADCVPATPIRS